VESVRGWPSDLPRWWIRDIRGRSGKSSSGAIACQRSSTRFTLVKKVGPAERTGRAPLGIGGYRTITFVVQSEGLLPREVMWASTSAGVGA
jgi:hypothetical protein